MYYGFEMTGRKIQLAIEKKCAKDLLRGCMMTLQTVFRESRKIKKERRACCFIVLNGLSYEMDLAFDSMYG
jgi:hypothetical protein